MCQSRQSIQSPPNEALNYNLEIPANCVTRVASVGSGRWVLLGPRLRGDDVGGGGTEGFGARGVGVAGDGGCCSVPACAGMTG